MPQNIALTNGKVLTLREIPEGYKIEYIASRTNGEYFYVVHTPCSSVAHGDQSTSYYDSFRLHVGSLEEMREAKVEEVCRWRNGGTTEIAYRLEDQFGQLCFPSLHSKTEQPSNTFQGRTLKLIRLVQGRDF